MFRVEKGWKFETELEDASMALQRRISSSSRGATADMKHVATSRMSGCRVERTNDGR